VATPNREASGRRSAALPSRPQAARRSSKGGYSNRPKVREAGSRDRFDRENQAKKQNNRQVPQIGKPILSHQRNPPKVAGTREGVA